MSNGAPKQWKGFHIPNPSYVLFLVIVGGCFSFLFGKIFDIAHPASLFLNFVIITFFVASGLTITRHPHALLHRVVFFSLLLVLIVIRYPWE